MNRSDMNIDIPQQYEFLFKPRRYKVMYSGRAAGKSWSIAQALLVLGLSKKLRILCTREFQNSITDSVHKLLSDINDRYQLGYTITNNSIYHETSGSEFMFYGLKTNITKIKSLESVDICWVEEAETISERSLEVLIPTIRKEGSEIWMSFNPYHEDDAVYAQFVKPYLEDLVKDSVYIDQKHYVLRTGYWENPFLPETIKSEIQACREQDYRKYLHIYQGEPIGDNEFAIIKPEWFDAAIDAHRKLKWDARGMKAVGFDPADTGSDAKAAVYRHGSVVYKIDAWTDGDLGQAVERVYTEADRERLKEIVYDSIGVGAGVKTMFNIHSPDANMSITPFNGAASPDKPNAEYKEGMQNRDMFRNKRAQFYWLLRDRFEATYRAVEHGEYVNPDDMISIDSDCENIEQLKHELTKIQEKRSGTSSLVQIESKQDMRKRQMRSPNIADALMYCFSASARGVDKPAVPAPQINFISGW